MGVAMALVLALICLPGMNLVQQISGAGFTDADATGIFDHGWPAVYLTREIENSPPLFHGPVVAWAPWRTWICWELNEGTTTKFSLSNLVFDIAVCFSLVALTIALWENRRRRRTNIWQVTLREMFAITLIVASIFAWITYQRNESRREFVHIRALDSLEDRLLAEGDSGRSIQCFAYSRPDVPVWAMRLIGPASIPEFLFHCDEVNVYLNSDGNYMGFSEAMPHLLELPRASLLWMEIPPNGAVIPFDDVGRLLQVRKLELATLENDVIESWRITPDDLRKLRHLDLIILPSHFSLSAECAAILKKEMPSCCVEFRDEE
jgi:hypothetical protein